MKLVGKPIEKRTVEELGKEKKTWLILAIFWAIALTGLAGKNLHGHPWWIVSLVLLIGSLLRYSVVALAIGLKKEIQELKAKIAKLE